jgi:hypothetical protein
MALPSAYAFQGCAALRPRLPRLRPALRGFPFQSLTRGFLWMNLHTLYHKSETAKPS